MSLGEGYSCRGIDKGLASGVLLSPTIEAQVYLNSTNDHLPLCDVAGFFDHTVVIM